MATRKKTGQVRIIGGTWRGRKLPVADVPGLRPTTDRIRETLFNWLTPYIGGARVLDVFAGTGALSFEALSRGAAHAQLIEQDRAAVQILEDNVDLLGADAQVLRSDARRVLSEGYNGMAFDLAFLDPPFADNDMVFLIDALERGRWLSDDALIYIEHATARATPTGLDVVRDKTAGGVHFGLYRARREGKS